jgi:hypothetical protein
MGRFTAHRAAQRLTGSSCSSAAGSAIPPPRRTGRPARSATTTSTRATPPGPRGPGLWEDFERETGTDVLVRCGCLNIASGSVTPDLAQTYAERSHRILRESACAPRSSTAASCRPLPVPGRRPRPGRPGRRRRRPARVTRTLTRELAAGGVRTLEGVRRPRSSARASSCASSRTRGGSSPGRSSSRRGTARTTSWPGSRAASCRSRSAGTARARPSTSPRPRRARQVHGGRHAGRGLPGHGDLLPPDRPRARRGREDRLLQPAGHAARGARASTPSRASSSSACPACAGRPRATSRTSTAATTTSWPTTSSSSARSRAAPGAFVGVGWRGTGYKFAPWVGQVLAGLVVTGTPPRPGALRSRALRPDQVRGRSSHVASVADDAAAAAV